MVFQMRSSDAWRLLPFTIIDKSSEKPVGMTTYMNIDAITPRLDFSQMIMTQGRIRQPTNAVSGCWLNAFEK